MAEETSIRFQFENMDAAQQAFATLSELGYRPTFDVDTPGIYIYPYRQDLTSALEIAHTFGGNLSTVEDPFISNLEEPPYFT